MSEKIFLDLETTGLNYNKDKIIEICCLNIKDRKIIKKKFHYYLNPLIPINHEALLVHGIKDDFLKDKPLFSQIVNKFLKFIYQKKIIIHNSDFDVKFLNKELFDIGLKSIDKYCYKIIDTLDLAKKIFPGKKNSLNALCKRFNIDISERKFHGACLDVKLLFKVYIQMTQNNNKLNFKNFKDKKILNINSDNILVIPDEFDLKSHNIILNKIKKKKNI